MAMPPKLADAVAEPPSEIRLIRNTVRFDSLGIHSIVCRADSQATAFR